MMKRHVFVIALLAAICAAGCQGPQRGRVIEQTRIPPDAKITVLWDIGRFSDPTVNAAILSNNIYGKEYEACTSAMFRTTFANNGLDVEVRRAPLSSSKSITVNSPYALILRITKAGYDYRWKDVSFVGEVELLDTQKGKKLWSFDSYLERMPQFNGRPAYSLVRGLVVDGYVDKKLEEVRDHYNRIPPTRYDSLYNHPECP